MTEIDKMRFVNFYSYYFCLISAVTCIFHWFNAGQPVTWLRLVLLLVIPLPVLWWSCEKQREIVEERKLPQFHFGFLCIPALLVNTAGSGYYVPVLLFFAAALSMCFAGEYVRRRYLLLDCNPCVSLETGKRVRRNMKKSLIKFFVAGVLTILFLVSVPWSEPEFSQEKPKTNTAQQETDRAPDYAGRKREQRQAKIKEEQEKKGQNIVLLILRYLVLAAIVVMGIAAVCYGVFRFLFYLIRGRRRAVWEYEEIPVEEHDNETYTKLVPVVKPEVGFPGGNDGKIRRQFYREIRRRAAGREIFRSYTPLELKEAYLDATEKEEMLTGLYEKARYADCPVSDEEISQWQNL